jgi:hypothetical protein
MKTMKDNFCFLAAVALGLLPGAAATSYTADVRGRWLMQTWDADGLWGVRAIVLLVPLARVSAFPLAMARNGNR